MENIRYPRLPVPTPIIGIRIGDLTAVWQKFTKNVKISPSITGGFGGKIS